jgi:hypothetical protein
MGKQAVSSAQKIWEGEIDGEKTRILQVAEDDCIVELRRLSEDSWFASSDKIASRAYMIAFLETRKQLKAVADFAVGNHP